MLYTTISTPNNPAPRKHSLLAHFEALPYPRLNRTKDHNLIDVLVVAIGALLCGAESFNDTADFGVALKDNHEKVHEEVKSFLDTTLQEKQKKRPKGAVVPTEVRCLQKFETVEKDHGRIETRRYYQSDKLDWFADQAKWEGLQSVGLVESIRELAGQTTIERRY